MKTTHRFPHGSDLLGACMSYGLGALHDHHIDGHCITFFAVGYGDHNYGQTGLYRATYKREGGILVELLESI